MLARIGDSLAQGGVTARAVLAGIAGAGAALARAGRHQMIVPPGKDAASVASLPLDVLRLSPDCLAGLHRLGLHRIDDLLRQPRGPLTRRFGRSLMDVLDALTGDRPRNLPAVRPPPDFIEAINFLEPIVTRPAIDRALDALLAPLCRQLGAAGQGRGR
jgi:protein ImuB